MEPHRLNKVHAANSTKMMDVMGNYMYLPVSYQRSQNEPLNLPHQVPEHHLEMQGRSLPVSSLGTGLEQ